ncbi:hypothetical protein BD410DRAFT_395883 [Rickenella mellea]|uniref:Uncharacterized protein n=1 Tax=Rickenella mellea TaxID=50990 RepID=A0A4Y7PZL6_9AGAM|nr:hypothetical protein BD410DRAFT_395883 [Rickenella mellea]
MRSIIFLAEAILLYIPHHHVHQSLAIGATALKPYDHLALSLWETAQRPHFANPANIVLQSQTAALYQKTVGSNSHASHRMQGLVSIYPPRRWRERSLKLKRIDSHIGLGSRAKLLGNYYCAQMIHKNFELA